MSQEPEAKGGFIAFQPLGSKGAVEIKLGHVMMALDVSEVVPVLLELDQAGLLYDPA